MKKKNFQLLSFLLAGTLFAYNILPTVAATTDGNISGREEKNNQLSMETAIEGMVLMKNEESVLPLDMDAGEISVYGYSVKETIKGGTGSGDVNQRSVVSIYDGMKEAGFTFSEESEQWIADYYAKEGNFSTEKSEFDTKKENDWSMIFSTFVYPDFEIEEKYIPQMKQEETAVYVLSRNSGEGGDRSNQEGDFELSTSERKNLERLANSFENVVLILNVGGVVDLSITVEGESD